MDEIFEALGLPSDHETTGHGALASRYAVTDLATSSLAAVGQALSALMVELGLAATPPGVRVDRSLASLWFHITVSPQGWELPPIWHPIAGDYEAADGWIRLHTNLDRHRDAACRALMVEPEREAVAAAVRKRQKDELEAAIYAQGGVAAAMRSPAEWAAHPQGKAVASEPLIGWDSPHARQLRKWAPTASRPLHGLRVLDLTRVLAGPVATRTLAGFGADVLRLDPPGWDEGLVATEITPGKRCAYVDLKSPEGRALFEARLAEADIFIHGLRPGALESLGLGERHRRKINPDTIEVTLDAYGWTGPWAGRRGFDSLVQMASGIAHAGMEWAGTDRPKPLPVQALDFATGYLMAAAAIKALSEAVRGAPAANARLSLARTAALLTRYEQPETVNLIEGMTDADLSPGIEETDWGPARRPAPPFHAGEVCWRWETPACRFGSASPEWRNP